MSRSARPILPLLLALAALAGCAQKGPPATQATASAAVIVPTGKASLALDQIQPAPVLPTSRPEQPASRPSLDAVELYARAQGDLLDGKRISAIPLLEKAAALDPGSFVLHRALADAYRGNFEFEDHSIEELEKAATINPDNLDVQVDLGRQYLAKGDAERAMVHLRLAIQTQEYKAGGDRAPEADLFLAHALQQQGYDRAALQRYEQLLARMGTRDLSRSSNPDLAYQVTDKLYTQVGDLYLKQGNPPAALEAYRTALQNADQGHEFADPTLYARIVRALLLTGQPAEALDAAAAAVHACHASPESVALLRESCRAMGQPASAVDALRRLHAQDPSDKPILFALADVLRGEHRAGEADQLLARSADADPGDGRVVCKRASLHQADGDLSGAARLLIDAAARRPGLTGELQDAWDHLLQPSDPEVRARLSLDALRKLDVASGAEASRAFAVSLDAERWPRRTLARSALDEAIARGFPPAFRARLDEIWSDDAQTREAQLRRSEDLCAAAERAGNPSLAAELRGRSLLARGDDAGAAAALAEAVKLTGPAGADPDLQLAFAGSYRAFGDDAEFERRVRKLIADHPGFDPAYEALHVFFIAKGQFPRAEALTAMWREAEPGGLAVRLDQVDDQVRLKHPQTAKVILDGLLDEFPDDPRVLAESRAVYGQTHELEQLKRMLQDRLIRRPQAFNCAQLLARLEGAVGHITEASRVLDAARAVAVEPDVLYELSHAYARLGQKQTCQDVLRQVLKLDPLHAGANNDLGYALAEQGRDLDEAEALARVAVRVEPDNAALLDSLGWVLYRRGRFEDARLELERAVGADYLAELTSDAEAAAAKDNRIDPVVLDHLGDVMYRLHETDAAGKLWERSGARLAEIASARADADEAREDLGPLRLQLQEKQRQLKAGRPVSVAPVVEVSAPATAPATRSARAGD